MQNGMLHMESSFFLLGSFAENIRMLVSFVCGFFFSLHTFWSRSSKNHFCNIFDKLTCDPIICLRYLYRKHFYSHFNNLWMQSIGLVLAPFRGTHNLRNFSWYFFFIEISIFYELIIFQWKKATEIKSFACIQVRNSFFKLEPEDFRVKNQFNRSTTIYSDKNAKTYRIAFSMNSWNLNLEYLPTYAHLLETSSI